MAGSLHMMQQFAPVRPTHHTQLEPSGRGCREPRHDTNRKQKDGAQRPGCGWEGERERRRKGGGSAAPALHLRVMACVCECCLLQDDDSRFRECPLLHCSHAKKQAATCLEARIAQPVAQKEGEGKGGRVSTGKPRGCQMAGGGMVQANPARSRRGSVGRWRAISKLRTLGQSCTASQHFAGPPSRARATRLPGHNGRPRACSPKQPSRAASAVSLHTSRAYAPRSQLVPDVNAGAVGRRH